MVFSTSVVDVFYYLWFISDDCGTSTDNDYNFKIKEIQHGKTS
jgi:hypothetical protein